MDRIDFRSDTVTWPTPAMREAMARAPVGDDVYGEDPTINQLEVMAAEKLGKAAGLFVASGTMGNLVGILAHANRGDEAILGQDSHVYNWEAGGMSTLGGVVPRPLPTDDMGRMDPTEVEAAVREDDPHVPNSRLVVVENSYGAKNGYPLPPSYFAEIQAVARRQGLAVHMDGARLFNAAVALGVEAREITQYVDSVSFCLSKGLGAPVGSVLCGPADFIHRARRARKVLGGGMRQAGILAAAGLVALETMIDRLAEDHTHARLLAEGLARIPGIVIDSAAIKTNIVFFDLEDNAPLLAAEVVKQLRSDFGIWLGADGPRRFRAVTHYWVGRREVRQLVEGLRVIMADA